VARITDLALSVRSPPSFKRTTTLGAPSAVSNRATPSTTVILCLRIRKPTPFESCLATARERAITLPKS
jgi:hypothetical protein